MFNNFFFDIHHSIMKLQCLKRGLSQKVTGKLEGDDSMTSYVKNRKQNFFKMFL